MTIETAFTIALPDGSSQPALARCTVSRSRERMEPSIEVVDLEIKLSAEIAMSDHDSAKGFYANCWHDAQDLGPDIEEQAREAIGRAMSENARF